MSSIVCVLLMAEFKLSSRGHLYVLTEGFDEVPHIRFAFVVITAALGFLTLIKLTYHFLKLGPKTRKPHEHEKLMTTLFVTHFLSYAIHATHYADNISRPVAYLEPRWLYVKYVLSEMEITFFINFPITFIGLWGMEGILTGIQNKEPASVRRNCKRMIFYVIGSLLTLGHYRIEFPTHYSAFVNFTIAGEGAVTILLAIALWFTWKKFSSDSFNDNHDDDSGNLLNDIHGEDEYPRRDSLKGTSKYRRRSRTPIKPQPI